MPDNFCRITKTITKRFIRPQIEIFLGHKQIRPEGRNPTVNVSLTTMRNEEINKNNKQIDVGHLSYSNSLKFYY